MLHQLVLLSLLVAVSLSLNCYSNKEDHYGIERADSELGKPVDGGKSVVIPCAADVEYCITVYYTLAEPKKRTTSIWDCDSKYLCSDFSKTNPPKDGNGTISNFSISRKSGSTTRQFSCCKTNGCNNPESNNLAPYLGWE